MPSFTLPVGYHIMSLKADMNECCNVGGPFRHSIYYQLERFRKPETSACALFKIKQMAFFYTDYLMNQFPDLQKMISSATLAMQITEALIRADRESYDENDV